MHNEIELINGTDESWNRTLAQTLIPDFQPLKEANQINFDNQKSPYLQDRKMNGIRSNGNVKSEPPDIQSSHFTISPIKHELVHVDLLEGTHKSSNSNPNNSDYKSYNSSHGRKLPPPPPHPPTQNQSAPSTQKLPQAHHLAMKQHKRDMIHERIILHDSSASSGSSISADYRHHLDRSE